MGGRFGGTVARWLYQVMPEATGNGRGWRDIPPAPAPHGTFLAWHRGCRCDKCEAANQEFLAELKLRARNHEDWGRPTARKLSADERARLDPAVRARTCPSCGALRNHRCRNPHFPLHFAATHPERESA
jgi:glycine/D-amino acid oxidase-like deaminating enzyme